MLLIPFVPWIITNAANSTEYCWAFVITEQWFIELVIGFYEWLYESMVYGISYDLYECLY